MSETAKRREVRCTGVGWALRGLGVLALVVGVIGIFVPLLPTTIFLLIALWAFSRSSPRFHRWLYEHPRLGPPLRAWHQHRVIPPRAKAAAVGFMAVGLLLAAVVFATDGWVVGILALMLLPVACFVLMQRSAIPETNRGDA